MANKGNIAPTGSLYYKFSSGDIVHYLENDVLGFRIKPDFEKWNGFDNQMSYVRMRVVMQAKDLIVDTNHANDFVTRFFNDNQKGYQLDKNVISAIEPFMYPRNFDQLDPESVRHLALYGVNQQRFEELIKFSNLTLVADPKTGKQYFIVYLRPEKIIVDMLKDTKTNKIDGEVYIRRVVTDGDNGNDVKWLVEQITNNTNMFACDLNIDQIFALKK